MGCSGCYRLGRSEQKVPDSRPPTREDLEDFLAFSLTQGIGNPTPITDLDLYKKFVSEGLIKED